MPRRRGRPSRRAFLESRGRDLTIDLLEVLRRVAAGETSTEALRKARASSSA